MPFLRICTGNGAGEEAGAALFSYSEKSVCDRQGPGGRGFGITYTALDVGRNSLCCIKEYCPSEYVAGRYNDGSLMLHSSGDTREFELGEDHFLTEAEILDELKKNATVVHAWDSFEENGTAYYVMELLKGENLKQYSKDHSGQAVRAVALQMLMVIGNALGEIHRYGLLHGDISPENIILTESGDMKLIDFGTAKAIGHSQPSPDDKVYLKPGYAPPELYTLENRQGPWCDVYSLAASYYVLVSGVKVVDAASRMKGTACPSLYGMDTGISRELSDVIDHALALNYRERYQSMQEFLQDVGEVTRETDLETMEQDVSSETTLLSQSVLSRMKQEAEIVSQNQKGSGGFWGRKVRTLQYLELLENGRAIRHWNLTTDRMMSMGRHPDSDIMTPAHNMISRRHCRIGYFSQRRQFILEDAGSKYGTFLANGMRLQPGMSYPLRAGDQFYLFERRFTFRVVSE